jgi:hypothetical protein
MKKDYYPRIPNSAEFINNKTLEEILLLREEHKQEKRAAKRKIAPKERRSQQGR